MRGSETRKKNGLGRVRLCQWISFREVKKAQIWFNSPFAEMMQSSQLIHIPSQNPKVMM